MYNTLNGIKMGVEEDFHYYEDYLSKEEVMEDFSTAREWSDEIIDRLNYFVENECLTEKESLFLFNTIMKDLLVNLYEYCIKNYSSDKVFIRFFEHFSDIFVEKFDEIFYDNFERDSYVDYVSFLYSQIEEYSEV